MEIALFDTDKRFYGKPDGRAGVIYYGQSEAFKTEADAGEAAELLKAFFEAKSKGLSARLVCGETIPGIVGGVIDTQRPKNTVIDQMNDDAANYQPCLNCKNPIYCQWGKKCSPGNTADSIADRIWGNRAHDMTLEQYEALTIAHNATQIFAHGGYTSHAAAVADAAEIWRLARQVEI